jgi:hypothetical protein
MPGTGAPDPVTAALAALRAGLPLKSPNARHLAAIRDNPACNARRVLDAAGVDKSSLAQQLGQPMPEGQSIFALQRGGRFEQLVKDDNYAELIRLLRASGFPMDAIRVLPLRDLYPVDPRNPSRALARRAAETRSAIVAMAEGRDGAINLIDGGALEWDFGGAIARLEADGIAWRIGDRIRVIEIKSFPIVDGRADSGKVGGAAWQSAVYVAALIDLLEDAGLDASIVSTEVLLIASKNTSLVPTIVRLDVSRHVRTLRRMLERRASISTILAALPPGVTLDTEGLDEDEAADHLADVLETLGTNYLPSCLSGCPLAYHCRERARASGDTACLGVDARASLGAVRTLDRALELAHGAPADPAEADVARQLMRAQALLDVAGLPAALPPARRRDAA